jgi:hypothetical protein
MLRRASRVLAELSLAWDVRSADSASSTVFSVPAADLKSFTARS